MEGSCPFHSLMTQMNLDHYQNRDVMKLLRDVERLVASSSSPAQIDFYHHQLNSLGHWRAHDIPERSFR